MLESMKHTTEVKERYRMDVLGKICADKKKLLPTAEPLVKVLTHYAVEAVLGQRKY